MEHNAHQVILGTVANSNGQYAPGAVWIKDSTILKVTHEKPTPQELDGVKVMDVTGAFILPGAVDAHVHSYSENSEGLRVATRAAAAGGVTTVVEMPFDDTEDGPVRTARILENKKRIVEEEAVTDVALLGTLWPGGGWREADSMVAAGAVGFKVSTYHTDTKRFPRTSDAELLNTMAAIAANESTLCVHAENNEIVQELSALAQKDNPRDPLTHVRTRPPVSESLGVLTAMEIAATTGAALHLCHMSIPRAVKLARWWREDGADITLETCPHYLTFTEEDMLSQNARLKINPPLRTAEHRAGMWEGLADGFIPVISSDHAPWPLSKKSDPEILKNASGAPGVQTLTVIPLGKALASDSDPSGLFHNVVKALTEGPAQRFGFGDRKGKLEPGYDADIMIFRPSSDYKITDEEQQSNAGWTPYAGMQPGGYIEKTILRGREIFSRDTHEILEGHGLLVTRN